MLHTIHTGKLRSTIDRCSLLDFQFCSELDRAIFKHYAMLSFNANYDSLYYYPVSNTND